jgi:hypothetical protein
VACCAAELAELVADPHALPSSAPAGQQRQHDAANERPTLQVQSPSLIAMPSRITTMSAKAEIAPMPVRLLRQVFQLSSK